jgi:hypothetical protein
LFIKQPQQIIQAPAGAHQQIINFNKQINKGKRSVPNKQGPQGRINSLKKSLKNA